MSVFCRLILITLVCVYALQAHAQPQQWEWQGQAVRLTCLPGQNFAILEPFYLDTMPKKGIKAYAAQLAKQGIYAGTSMPYPPEPQPLTAQCRIGKHIIKANFTYNASADLAIDNDPSNTLSGHRSFQHCQSLNSLTLESLEVDGTKWLETSDFAHDCLDSQIHRLRIYPEYKMIQACTQSIGGQIEDAPLSIRYSTLSLDEDGNPPMPEVTCKNLHEFPATLR